jgi:hypothetical protein
MKEEVTGLERMRCGGTLQSVQNPPGAAWLGTTPPHRPCKSSHLHLSDTIALINGYGGHAAAMLLYTGPLRQERPGVRHVLVDAVL